jgi:hypothetical protein
LRLRNSRASGGAHLSTFPFGRFRRGGGWSWATVEYRPDLCNSSVYPAFLGLEAFDGGGKDFGSQLMWGHLNQSDSIDVVRPPPLYR